MSQTYDELRRLLDDPSHTLTADERSRIIKLIDTFQLDRIEFEEMERELAAANNKAAQRRKVFIEAFRIVIDAALQELANS